MGRRKLFQTFTTCHYNNCLQCCRSTLSKAVLLLVLNWRLKNSREKVVSQRQRKVLPYFVPEIWGTKFRNRNIFIGPPTHPYAHCNWDKFRELPIGQEQSVWAKNLQNIHSSAFSWSSTLEWNNLSLTVYF